RLGEGAVATAVYMGAGRGDGGLAACRRSPLEPDDSHGARSAREAVLRRVAVRIDRARRRLWSASARGKAIARNRAAARGGERRARVARGIGRVVGVRDDLAELAREAEGGAAREGALGRLAFAARVDAHAGEGRAASAHVDVAVATAHGVAVAAHGALRRA